MTIQLTDATFAETVSSSTIPVVVDFWADWCGPCKAIAPIVEELSAEQAGKISFAKLDVDENVATATLYSVMSIPTLLVFKDGEVVGRIVGAQPKSALLEAITAATR